MALDRYAGWQGSNPFYLMIALPDGNVGIDLDEQGWMTTYADKFRLPGRWVLVHKGTGSQVLVVNVDEGDQPYYTARHVGVAGGGGTNEITVYGIGKKCVDSSVVNLWIMPDGSVCGGDDVDILGVAMVKRIGPKQGQGSTP